MNNIDATNGLTQSLISDFGKSISLDETIYIFKNKKEIKTTDKANLVNDLLLSYDDFKDNDIFILATDYCDITFDGHNLNWWKKTSKRIEKFQLAFSDKSVRKKEKLQIIDKQYSVAVAYGIDNCLSGIEWFEGSKSEAINFINDTILRKYFTTSITTKIVINLAFDKDKFEKVFKKINDKYISSEEERTNYKHNFEMWYTLDELSEIGAVTIK